MRRCHESPPRSPPPSPPWSPPPSPRGPATRKHFGLVSRLLLHGCYYIINVCACMQGDFFARDEIPELFASLEMQGRHNLPNRAVMTMVNLLCTSLDVRHQDLNEDARAYADLDSAYVRAYEEGKRLLAPYLLQVKRIDACTRGCILFTREHGSRTCCPQCQEPRCVDVMVHAHVNSIFN